MSPTSQAKVYITRQAKGLVTKTNKKEKEGEKKERERVRIEKIINANTEVEELY